MRWLKIALAIASVVLMILGTMSLLRSRNYDVSNGLAAYADLILGRIQISSSIILGLILLFIRKK